MKRKEVQELESWNESLPGEELVLGEAAVEESPAAFVLLLTAGGYTPNPIAQRIRMKVRKREEKEMTGPLKSFKMKEWKINQANLKERIPDNNLLPCLDPMWPSVWWAHYPKVTGSNHGMSHPCTRESLRTLILISWSRAINPRLLKGNVAPKKKYYKLVWIKTIVSKWQKVQFNPKVYFY